MVLQGKPALRGDRIRAARQALRLKQADVAAQIGMSLSAYGRLERGKTVEMPPADTYLRLCVLLNVSARYGMDLTDEPQMPVFLDPLERRLICASRRMNPAGKEALVTTAEESQGAIDKQKVLKPRS